MTPAPPGDGAIRVLLVEELPELARHIQRLLEPVKGIRLISTVTDGGKALDAIDSVKPDTIIVDALMQGRISGLALARAIREAGVHIPLLMLTVPERPVVDAAVPGIARVVTMPIDGLRLLKSIEAVHREYRGASANARNRTYVIHSGKGGVGKTTIAHSLAVAFAGEPEVRVALVDADLQFGDLRAWLGIPDDALSMFEIPVGRISDGDVTTVMWHDASGVDVLLPPARIDQAEMITADDLGGIMSALRHSFDIVVVDCPSVINDVTLSLFDMADRAVGIITPEVGVVRHARRQEEALAAAGYRRERFMLALNRAGMPGMEMAGIVQEIGRAPDALLPHDPGLWRSGNGPGQAMVGPQPDAPFKHSIFELARGLEHPTPALAATR